MAIYQGFGVVFSWDSTGGTSFTTIGQIYNISSDRSRRTIDMSHHGMATEHELLITGLRSGTISFDVRFDPSASSQQHRELQQSFELDTTPKVAPNWRFEFKDDATPGTGNGTRFAQLGYITAFNVKSNVGEGLEASMTLSMIGDVTFTAKS